MMDRSSTTSRTTVWDSIWPIAQSSSPSFNAFIRRKSTRGPERGWRSFGGSYTVTTDESGLTPLAMLAQRFPSLLATLSTWGRKPTTTPLGEGNPVAVGQIRSYQMSVDEHRADNGGR